ncbi:MAG: radical SAM protein [Acidobacteriota bacterium]
MARRVPADPLLVVAGPGGELREVEGVYALARSGGTAVRPDPRSWVPLPEGALLFHLPGRRAIGLDPTTGRPAEVASDRDEQVTAAAAFLPPAFTALYLSAYRREPEAPALPLYCYAAVGWRDGTFVVPALRVDPDRRQDVALFDEQEIERAARETLARFPGNRLARHLVENCALTYCCPAARNFVLGRWEAPLPSSPACNADCIGCLSYQPEGEVPVTQPRLTIRPTPEEIAEIATWHLERAPRAIVSFGQGCEGEPLLRGEVIEEAIRRIRAATRRGTININTNASRPDVVRRLVDAGLDAIRISLNSCREELYERYYRPRGYGFEDLVASGRAVADAGGTVSLNYFMFPGITDTEDEFAALCRVIERAGVSVIQMRNLNIDPDLYLERLGLPADLPPGFGIDRWRKRLGRQFRDLRFGYFNPPREAPERIAPRTDRGGSR